MPRPKVTDELRRRVAKACLRCQESKSKCDGLVPCAPCTKRGRQAECDYSLAERSYGRHRRRRDARRQQPSDEQGGRACAPAVPKSSDNSEPWPSPSQHRRPLMSDSPRSTSSLQTTRERSRPRTPPRMLYDTRGRIVYLGECAASAFLQHIQGFLEVDAQASTEQPVFSKLTAIEEMPLHETRARHSPGGPGSISDLQDLIDDFFISTCGILDIIDRPHVQNRLHDWRNGNLEDGGHIAVLFLIIACGAQSRSASTADSQYSKYYYHEGRRLALIELTDEPRVETVQAFALISFYMLSSSQRNGSFLNLGTAVSAAKSLGFHRDDVNAMLSESNCQLRRRIWRTLRYQDLFFCAMMGRTPSTMTTDSYYTEDEDDERNQNPSFPTDDDLGQSLALCEALRAFSIMERAIYEVYTARPTSPTSNTTTTSSLARLDALARELQTATSAIPCDLRVIASAPSNPRDRRRHVIRNAHVACSYYFSMMLLTRPFLMTCVQQRSCQRTGAASDGDVPVQLEERVLSAEVSQGALAAVDSAVHVVRLIHELLMTNMLFNNMVLIIAMVFVASLTLCSAYLGRQGSRPAIEQAIRQTETILAHFSAHTRQGKRYGYILRRFYKAAKLHRLSIEKQGRRIPTLEMPQLFSLTDSGNSTEEGCRGGDEDPRPLDKTGEETTECHRLKDGDGRLLDGIERLPPMSARDRDPGPSVHSVDSATPPSAIMDWQEMLLLKSPQSSITDMIDSLAGPAGGIVGTDGGSSCDPQGYMPFPNFGMGWDFLMEAGGYFSLRDMEN
ncbi:hypothetical protein VTK73DRAFT_5049 [Phialemonium thermophilum]|uniref:Zn(2)-C6 fungal-type domain-containing protein n=1 Tax=Phialemonium thermophilum TaxID=223376 RepID=A0ABR3WQ69_9PEZI